ncbi:MAG: ADP-ribosylglycohydrolase family protein [Saprospiraceae bacterium]|nr:ADP-ribosylglycohydrolase family protein [Saprospiraceae bacterium]
MAGKEVQAVRAALFGLAVADALGVPVEFKSRAYLSKNPVTDMQGYGTYNQPPGTWSDDSSLTFCLAESLCHGYNLVDIAQKLVAYMEEAYWTPYGEVFDIGNTTAYSLKRVAQILKQEDYSQLRGLYSDNEMENGNGALMRILPLLFHIQQQPLSAQFQLIWEVSALTHGHIRSAIACTAYLSLASQLLKGVDKWSAYRQMQKDIAALMIEKDISLAEQKHFDRIIEENIYDLEEDEISSSGYVMHSLEASLWCLLKNDDYPSTVFAAINLGEDTDTTAAITGGLAGILYGFERIPSEWIQALARKEDIDKLCLNLAKAQSFL